MDKLNINNYYKDAYEAFYHLENILRISIHYKLIDLYGTSYFKEENFPEYDDKFLKPQNKFKQCL